MVGVYAMGSVSGANFNPAVTLSLLLASAMGHGDMKFVQAALYWVVQLIAGVCAGMASGVLWSTSTLGPSSTVGNAEVALAGAKTVSSVALGPQGSFGLWEVFWAEALYTALLCFVVLSVATTNDAAGKKNEKNYYFGLAIGLTVAAGASAIGHISGCSMNPAVSFGVSMSAVPFGAATTFGNQVGMFFFYTFCELFGALLGFGFFAVCRKLVLTNVALVDKLAAEFIGTFYLVLTVCFVVAQGANAPLVGVIGIASALMVGIYSTAAVSGGNLNPAVSLGLLLTGNLSPKDFGLYLLVQILGGFAAVGKVWHIEKWKVTLVQNVIALKEDNSAGIAALTNATVAALANITNPATNATLANITAADGQAEAKAVEALAIHISNGSWAAVAVSEFFYTFLLVFVVLNVAVRDAGNQYYGLAIGFVVIVGGVSVGGLSGGCFNPAIALSVDFGSLFADAPGNKYGWGFIYLLIELAGGAAAAGVFKLISGKVVKEEEYDSADSGSDMS